MNKSKVGPPYCLTPGTSNSSQSSGTSTGCLTANSKDSPADYSGLKKCILALPVDPYQSLNEKQEPISIDVDSTGVKVNRAGGGVERKHGKKKR